MVHRLETEGYLERRGRGVVLTPMGQRRAESVVRKHRLAERFLVDVVGLPWARAHAEAGRWEHVISDEVEARFVEILGNPATCPHGNPIPGGPPVTGVQFALAEAEAGTIVRLARITEQVEVDDNALEYLSSSGFIPGVEAKVVTRGPDGTLTLDVDGRSAAFGPAISRQLFVESLVTA